MSFIEFDDATHSYYCDGIRVPSVSEILSPLNDFSSIPPEVLEIAANRGTFLHDQIDTYYTDGVLATTAYVRESTPIDEPDYNLWWQGFMEWKDRQCLKPLLHEKFMIGEWEGLKFGMTPDFLSECNMLIDWKTCSALKRTHAIQLEAYKLGLESNGYEVSSVAIGHLRKNKSFRLVDENTARQAIFNKYTATDKQVFIEHLIKWYRKVN